MARRTSGATAKYNTRKSPMEQLDFSFFNGIDRGRFPNGFSLGDFHELCRIRYELNSFGKSESINERVSGYCAKIGFDVCEKGVGFLISK